MATWVKANLSYSRVLEQVAPLEKQLNGLTAGLEESQGRLAQCQEELMGLDQQVTALKTDFQMRIREAEALKLELARAEATLSAATGMLVYLTLYGAAATGALSICFV
jgi:dynein heavy chain 2